MNRRYIANPNKVYELELNKLQRCFSEVQRMGEEASDLKSINWRHVEVLRHMNFILEEVALTGKTLIENSPLTTESKSL